VKLAIVRQLAALALVFVCAASTWFYIERILKPQQMAYDAAHHRPRGNFSDLYPRWLGARELFLHRRNPYSPEITREIQAGYYGRPLDPTRAEDPRDQQAFAYPVYVVFLLRPTINLPFADVQSGFRWLLAGLMAASVLFWIRALRQHLSIPWKLTAVVLMLGWLPTVQGIKLQQLTLLVFALLTGCACLLQAGSYAGAGVLLALATIKPQLAWPLAVGLVFWAWSGWRSRWPFLWGFGFTMLLLIVGGELILPGWIRMFWEAMIQYRGYTSTDSVSEALFGLLAGRALELTALLASAALLWRHGKIFGEQGLPHAIALILALTVLLVPKTAPYNQILMLPAILSLVYRARSGEPTLPAIRMANRIGGLLLIWPWIATVIMGAAYFWLSPELKARFSPSPFYTNLMLPVFVFVLALIDTWMNVTSMNHPHTLRDDAQAE
jgi:hypothetical protein